MKTRPLWVVDLFYEFCGLPCWVQQVRILSRALDEVDKIVQEFKDMLYKTMENPNVDLTQVYKSTYNKSCYSSCFAFG